jgi:transcription initiation factor TFIIH subunit 2
MSQSVPRAPACLEEDADEDEEIGAHDHNEFDRKYLDERSWEALVEDEHGRLVTLGHGGVHRKRLRPAEASSRVRRGLIRCVHSLIMFCIEGPYCPSGSSWQE